MINEIILGLIQSLTECLPVSSKGHMALYSNYIGSINLYLLAVLHLASLVAILIYTRKEISEMIRFDKEGIKLITMLLIGTLPAVIAGFLLKHIVEQSFSSLFVIGISLMFTGIVLFFTKFTKGNKEISYKDALIIGLIQMLALFPGVSRSGMTISTALFLGIDSEKATKFSFLLSIPIYLGAFTLMLDKFYIDLSLIIAFIITVFGCLLALKLLDRIVKANAFWIFSFYCFILGIIVIIISL